MTSIQNALALIEKHWLVLTALALISITTGSLWPADQLPDLPGSDKTHHLIGYALLTFPVALARPRHWLWIALAIVVWSGAIELIQPYVNRYGEWLDLAANASGVVFGIFLAAQSRRLR